jgi:hypothetical protein
MSDPFKITEPTVISFSGGRTSAYMLWRVLQSNDGLPDDAIVCFANTGKEDEATLQFVLDCEFIWNVKIHWLEYTNNEPRFKLVDFNSAARNGEPFNELITKRQYLPNPVTRFCTVDLKIRTIHKYLKSIGWEHTERDDWIGIRADEPRRAAKIEDKARIPLYTAGVTVNEVLDFWKYQPFDLRLPTINGKTMHGNCDLCFLKPGAQILSLIQEKPSRAIWWAEAEAEALTSKPDGARFRKDRPGYAQMLKFAQNQQDMFDQNEESIACFCGD